MEVKVVNMTPHDIVFLNGDQQVVIKASGMLARVSTETVRTGEVSVNGMAIPTTETRFGEVEGLPAPEEGTIFIVSSLVAQRCRNRSDIFIPNESVRDDKGRIIGCRSLGRV